MNRKGLIIWGKLKILLNKILISRHRGDLMTVSDSYFKWFRWVKNKNRELKGDRSTHTHLLILCPSHFVPHTDRRECSHTYVLLFVSMRRPSPSFIFFKQRGELQVLFILWYSFSKDIHLHLPTPADGDRRDRRKQWEKKNDKTWEGKKKMIWLSRRLIVEEEDSSVFSSPRAGTEILKFILGYNFVPV